MDKTKVQLCFEQGMEEYQKGKYEKALSWFEEVISEQPDFFEALYNISCCCAQLGDHENALVYLGQAIRLNPECRQWANEDAEFDALKDLHAFQELLAEPTKKDLDSYASAKPPVVEDFQELDDSSFENISPTTKSESEKPLLQNPTQKSEGFLCIRCGNAIRIERRSRWNPMIMVVMIYFGILLSLFIFLTWWGILGIPLVMWGLYLFSLVKDVWVCPHCKAEGKRCGQIQGT